MNGAAADDVEETRREGSDKEKREENVATSDDNAPVEVGAFVLCYGFVKRDSCQRIEC